MMKPKELVALRAEMRALFTGTPNEGWSPKDTLFFRVLDRLDAIEDALGFSYVMPEHEHRSSHTITMIHGVPVAPCAERGCTAHLPIDRRGRAWVEPEES